MKLIQTKLEKISPGVMYFEDRYSLIKSKNKM